MVGLTGGIATGKSAVSSLLKAKGIPIVDADILAREVVAPGTAGLKSIIKAFGDDILLPDGTLNRKKLGSIIFNDETKRKQLNGIVHPAVRKAMLWGVFKAWITGNKLCILDVPLLIEGGTVNWVGSVVVVHWYALLSHVVLLPLTKCLRSSPETQLERLMKRDGSTREEASSRIASQMFIEDKVKYADYPIDNSGSLEQLTEKVDQLVQTLDSSVGRVWWRLEWICAPLALLSAAYVLARKRGRRVKTD